MSFFGGQLGCACAPLGVRGAPGGGNDCGPGTACGYLPPNKICAPMYCGGAYPTCGGGCGDGGECSAVHISALTDCLCALPEPCDVACGGLSCPSGQVCTVASGTCGCE